MKLRLFLMSALLVAAVCGHSIAGYLFAASAAAFGVVIFFHKKSRVAFVSLCLLVYEMLSDVLTRFVVFLDVFCFFEVLDIIPPKNMEFCFKSLQI